MTLHPALEVDRLARATGDTDLATVVQHLVTDAGRLLGLGIDQRNVGDMDRRFLLDDAAGVAAARPRVALDHVDALDQHAVDLAVDAQHLAAAAAIPAGDHDHLVAFTDLELLGH